MEDIYEKLQKLMNSYVPEFAYEREGTDPGSVMTDLCGNMLDECARRYAQVIPKHEIQYLNLFDGMLKEPVTASRGYVQFRPVTGYEGMIPVPAGTQVLADIPQVGTIIFETEQGITSTDTHPVIAAVTDRDEDRIVIRDLREQKDAFTAFSVEGENCSGHRLYLCFDNLFDWVRDFELCLSVRASSQADQEKLLEILSSDDVSWSMLEAEGKEYVIEQPAVRDGHICLPLKDYVPQRVLMGQKEGYYLILACKEKLPRLYVDTLYASFGKEQIIPEAVYLNGVQETAGVIFPFGKPLSLYHEFSLEDREVFSRRGAKIRLQFQLDYRIHEEIPEVVELDTEYKAIMKKPRKPLTVRPEEVMADYVCWEYLSRTGWKRLLKDEHLNAMFNGSAEGNVVLEFRCPEDMAEYTEENQGGRIRARLLQAENIYKVPALYKCPVISGLKLSYSYKEDPVPASYALAKNNFEERDVTRSLQTGGSIELFHHTEHSRRTMYLGFDAPIAGTPLSLYFDIENYSDRPVDFQVEYLSDHGFVPVRLTDYTGGFCGSGNMLLVVPEDSVRRSMFGYEGYFLRFINFNKDNPEYALPRIRGIYPNMARVVNVSTTTEEFYLDRPEDELDLQLSRQNLLKVSVKVREKTSAGYQWVLWKRARRAYEGGRTYQVDMAGGILHFRKNTFVNFELPEEGPHILVEHSNYTGARANLPAGSVNVLGNAIRYISSVVNPFPTYGGYDGYSEETVRRLVTGMLRTRNRAVTRRDYYDLISQAAYGVRQVKSLSGVDAEGNEKPGCVTVAVLIEEYEKGAHVFSGVKQAIRDRLMEDGALTVLGRDLNLIQPHFIKLNVRVWLEKESMEQAYELQQRAKELIIRFIDPLGGGVGGKGWEIGEFPRADQLVACLRTGISGCSIARIVLTAMVDGREIPVTDEFYDRVKKPFLMAVNGEHKVYIEVTR